MVVCARVVAYTCYIIGICSSSLTIPQQHLAQSLQEPVQCGVVAAVVYANEQDAHVVQDVHNLA